jgi:hypothetical protein
VANIDVVNITDNPLNPYLYTIVPNKILFSRVISPNMKVILASTIYVFNINRAEHDNDLTEEELIQKTQEEFYYTEEEIKSAISVANTLMELK